MAIQRFTLLMVALTAVAIPGCKSGAERDPLRLDTLMSGRSQDNATAATSSMRAQERLTDFKSTDFDALVKKPVGEDSSSNPFTASVKNAASSVKEALTIDPKVVPAADPTSLTYDPGKLQPSLYVSAAALLEQQGRTDEAIAKYEAALAQTPNHRPALIGLARLRHRLGDMEGATQLYVQALEAFPNDPVVMNDLALCYARSDKVDQAIQILQHALTLKPDSTLYRNNLAAVLVEANRPGEAVTVLTQSHGLAVAHYNVGYLLHLQGNSSDAVSHFDQALRANPALQPARQMIQQLAPTIGSRPDSRQQSAAPISDAAPSGIANMATYESTSGPEMARVAPVSYEVASDANESLGNLMIRLPLSGTRTGPARNFVAPTPR